MKLDVNGFAIDLTFQIRNEKDQYIASPVIKSPGLYEYSKNNVFFCFSIDSSFNFEIELETVDPSSLKISIQLNGENDFYHVIPCNIHGDNNLENTKPGFFPNLTYKYPESVSTSPEWEFRADRASHPVSLITCKNGAVGISISPYSIDSSKEDGFIRNGVFARLPDTAGVSIGYRNFPYTFTFKEMLTQPTAHTTCKASAQGKIHAVRDAGRTACGKILRDIYYENRDCPKPHRTAGEYLAGFLDSYENINWSDKFNAFTNEECRLPDDSELKPWRPLIATGWTGTGVLVYPLLSAQLISNIHDDFSKKLYGLFDEMSGRTNPATGLFYDLIRPWNGSDVNGWWAGYMVKDCHCSYTNGNGIYYLLKTYEMLLQSGEDTAKEWLAPALTALDSIIKIQEKNGNYGYTYSLNELKIEDKHGFAGCWFAAACALAYRITGSEQYLSSAKRGIAYYYEYVKNLNCWGTPMDTWKSIDQEGNLAFIKAAAILHTVTGQQVYATMLNHGAEYEYMWRYCFKARPEFKPLKNSPWNSCGGSVTSVSNPHIHPMGVNVTAELIYLYRITGDTYHLHRAMDGLCWGLATADLYPETTGYGQLGVITERYCPSDGLTIEKYSDTGEPSSIWFTFNGWAGVSILEGLTEILLKECSDIDNPLEKNIYEIFKSISLEEKL